MRHDDDPPATPHFQVYEGGRPPRPHMMRDTGARAGLQAINPAIDWPGKPVPTSRWLVDGLIPLRNVTALSGDGGLGKSLLSLQLAVACATGTPFLGRPVEQCNVLVVACEDEAEELHRRIADILEAAGLGMEDLENMQIAARVGMENSMCEFPAQYGSGETTALHAQILNHAIENDCKLVILDSLHDLFTGNENNRQQARQFVGCLREIATETDGSVLLCAHPSVAGRNSGTGESGSTAWNNAVRSRLYLTRSDDNQNGRILSTKKTNYAGIGKDIELEWRAGAFVPVGGHDSMQRFTDMKIERRIFETVAARWETAEPAGAVPQNGDRYLPRILAQTDGFNVRHVERNMRTLINGGYLVVEVKSARVGKGLRVHHTP